MYNIVSISDQCENLNLGMKHLDSFWAAQVQFDLNCGMI